RRQYQYDARRQQGDGGGVFGDSQFTSTLSVNFHFPKIPRRTFFYGREGQGGEGPEGREIASCLKKLRFVAKERSM
ncbi:hypothetical protein ACET70_24415, partial [Aeromonas caviae]|uniref:hypothetical protein n=1 Tax=Aeromonas caviae TaxID=648 RepID=UPI0038D2532C